MSGLHEAFLSAGIVWALLLVIGFLAAALRGPSLLERVLALDALSMCIVAALALLAIAQREAGYLDAALGLALLGFLGTVVASRYRAGDGPFE